MEVMIDLETLGLEPRTQFLSCGMVAFDPKTGVVQKDTATCFYPSLVEQADGCDRTTLQDTLDWWDKQGDEAKAETFKPEKERIPLDQFCDEIKTWLNKNSWSFKFRKVWSNGAGFDIPILEDLFRQIGAPIPWNFWNIMDTRTLWRIANPGKGNNTVKHSAKHDAIDQAERVCKSFQIIEEWMS